MWDNESRRIIESRDVLFDELIHESVSSGETPVDTSHDSSLLSGILFDATVPPALGPVGDAHDYPLPPLIQPMGDIRPSSPDLLTPVELTHSEDDEYDLQETADPTDIAVLTDQSAFASWDDTCSVPDLPVSDPAHPGGSFTHVESCMQSMQLLDDVLPLDGTIRSRHPPVRYGD